MPPQSRGTANKPLPLPAGFQSKSTPNLPTLKSLAANLTSQHPISPEIVTSPSEPASLEDFSLDASTEPNSISAGSSDGDDSAEEEDGHVSNLPPRPVYHHHSHSNTYLAPSTFAPPFYNRPPTPLPPSPSLTSLLRPNFSSANSRPSTPSPSSDEGTPHTRNATGTQTPNSAAASTLTSSFRTAKPIPRASPKVPTYEYYGFTLYLTSNLIFLVYLLWAFLPSPILHQLGIYYYPNRWWALAMPAWTVMLIVYIYVALASYNTEYLTLPMNSLECLVDEAANIAVVDAHGKIVHDNRPSWQTVEEHEAHGGKRNAKKGGGKGKHGGHSRQASLNKAQMRFDNDNGLDWLSMWNEGTDAVMDIPIGGVCEILYGADEENTNDVYE